MAKKRDVSAGSADTSGLRRSGREIPMKKATSSSQPSSKKSPRVEKQTSPVPSPLKDKLEKQVGSSPLRRSDRGKKSVEIPDLPNTKSTKEKTTNPKVVDVGNKRKRPTARHYKAFFKPQKILIPSDDEGPEVEAKSPQVDTSKNKVLESQDGIGVLEAPDKDHNMFLERKVIDLDEIEDDDCPQTKSPDGKSDENGDNHVVPASSDRIEHDLENQNHQELDTSHKVTEHNDGYGNMANSKFVEFWVPIQISNVQLEQYCDTLLSKETNLCSSVKGDPHGAIEEAFTRIRMCCNHPFIVDCKLETTLHQGFKDTISNEGELTLLDVGIKASGKLQFLDLVLPKIREQQLRVLILFHFMNGSLPLGEILANYVTQRFGQDSFERLEGVGKIHSKKQTPINTFNEDKSRFIFLLESRACHPTIRFSSVDIVIIFDSDINPSNDLKSLQKFSIESQSEHIKIFRLYSRSTLEEKILQYAENNCHGLHIRSQSSRSNYDALLTWGASDLFGKLARFHSQPGLSISSDSDESLQKDVVDEFLYILSHKCKSKAPTSKAITQTRNCGSYAKSSEVKTHLPNEDQTQAYLFWRELLNGQSADWKFVSKSTPRLRKRPSYFLDSSGGKGGEGSGGVKTRKRTVNNTSTVEAAQLKTVTGGVNEANNESMSPSGDQFWSTAVNSETSLLDQLKPTVSDLCDILKFSENVKELVEIFLEYVLENFQVYKEHTSALHAFMISLCWIGSSFGKGEIDRSESFALAKKHFDFSCTEVEANTVYIKLKEVKELFLKTQSQHVPASEGVKLVPQTSKEIPNSQESNETVSMKGDEAYEKQNELDQERENLKREYDVAKALTLAIFRNPSIQRNERLEVIERKLAKGLEELDRLSSFEDLKKATDGQVSADPEVAPTSRESVTEVQGRDEPVYEGGNDIESTGSHTSEKVMGEQIGEGPAQEVGDDVAADVVEKVDLVDTGVPEVDPSKQNAEGGITYPDVSHADVAEKVDLVETGVPEVDPSHQNAERGITYPDVSHAVEDNDETGVNAMPSRVDSSDVDADVAEKVELVEKGLPENDYSKENAEGGTADPGVAPMSPENVAEPQGRDEPVYEGGNDIEYTGSYTSEKVMGEQIGEVPTQEVGDDVEADVVEKVDLVETGVPEVDPSHQNAEGGITYPDESHAVEDNNETGVNAMASRVESGDVDADVAEKVELVERGLPENDYSSENAEGGTAENPSVTILSNRPLLEPTCEESQPGANQLDLTIPYNAPDIPPSSDPMVSESPSVTILPNGPLLEPAIEESQPGESQLDPTIPYNAPDIPPSTGPMVAETPSVTLLPNGPLLEPTIEESQPGVSQLDLTIPYNAPDIPPSTGPMVVETPSVTLLPNGPLLEHTIEESQPGASQLDRTIPYNAPDIPPSTVPMVAETPSVTLLPNRPLLKPTREESLPGTSQLDPTIPYDAPDIPPSTVPMVAETPSVTLLPNGPLLEPACEESQLRENLEENLAASADLNHQEHQPDLLTSVAPTPPVNPLNMFDNLMNQINPQMSNHNDPLEAEVERLYKVKENVTKLHQDVKQKLNVACEKEIAEIVAQIKAKYEAKHQQTDAAYNAKWVELESSINRVTMNRFLADAFRSKCQDLTPSGHSGRQQVMQQLQRQSQLRHRPPPLQVVHQPAALFSSPPSRPLTPGTNLRPSSTISTTLTRPPSSNSPSTAIRPPLVVNHTTPSTVVTTSRQSPSSNVANPSPLSNRASPSIARIDMSAANLRINTETRGQAPHARPLAGSEPRAPPRHIRPPVSNEPRALAPHMRPQVSNEPRAPAPHMRPVVNNEPRAPAPHLRSQTSSEIRAPAPHLRFRSQPSNVGSHQRSLPNQHATSGPGPSHQPVTPPVPTSSPQSIPPRPPMPSEPYPVSPSPPSTQTPVVVVPASDNLNAQAERGSRRVNMTQQRNNNGYILNSSSSSSAHDLVCLSDDD